MNKQIHLKLPDELHQALRVLAAASDTTIQDYALDAIRQKISREKYKLTDASKTITRITKEAARRD